MSIAMVFIEFIIAVSLCFYASLAKRVGYADQSHAARLPEVDATRPETAFSKNLGGEFSKKYAKGILGGAQHSSAVLGGGLGSHFALETGSSFVVKLSHNF